MINAGDSFIIRENKKKICFWLNIMEIRQIKYFITLARCENFTRASEVLHITQPTLSQQIAQLESELGVTLFNRSKKKSSLTPAGLSFLKEAVKLDEQYSKCFQSIVPFHTNQTLRIGRIEVFEPPTLLAKIHEYMSAAINVSVQYDAYPFDEVISRAESKEIDIGFISAPPSFKNPKLNLVNIGFDTISLIIPKQSKYAVIDSIYDSKTCEMFDSPCFFHSFWYFNSMIIDFVEPIIKKKIMPRYSESVSSMSIEMLSNNGFAICGATWFEKYAPVDEYKIIPLPDEIKDIFLFLIYAKDNNNPCIKSFIQMALPSDMVKY